MVANKDLLKNKKTERNMGLTTNQERLQAILEYKKYNFLKRVELINLIKKHKLSKNPEYLIKSMLLKKHLVSIKRSIYVVVPISSISKTPPVGELEIVDNILKENYYIGLFNAFNLHGFTEQIPNKLFVFNTKYSADGKILHYKIKFFKIKPAKIFGVQQEYPHYSDKERTIIDALDYSEYLGGVSQVLDQIKKISFKRKILVDYAIRYDSNKVIKLIGLLTGSNKLFELLKKKKALSYYTTLKNTGTKLLDKKWKLRLI
ncbi:hypothetical protein KAI32_03255 [Candidatus Pacearchaeota archaeon]|nr:hypothetical protein [Candidatus Pacearchaeota archaeon]